MRTPHHNQCGDENLHFVTNTDFVIFILRTFIQLSLVIVAVQTLAALFATVPHTTAATENVRIKFEY